MYANILPLQHTMKPNDGVGVIDKQVYFTPFLELPCNKEELKLLSSLHENI